MGKLSIIIPSRQERYLYQTIRDCFTKATGEVEVVVHLDGYWPNDWGQMTAQYPNLHTVHSGEAVGMRPGINKAAGSAISRGAKYLFKLDAHCMLDEGYDQKLITDMDADWIVIPRRKRLDAEKWELQDVGKPDIDYHYLSFPDDPDDWGGPGLNGKPWTQRILERLGKPEYDIDDECSSQGSAWAIHAEYFTYLGLMDTKSYGPFWNEFQECGMCCWLSGGSVKVNKKTWYAHLRKGKEYEGADGKKGRGYTLPESWLKSGRDHTMKWIWNEAWDQRQVRPFKWLIEKFPNMPGWPDNWEEILYATRKPRLVGAVSDNVGTVGSVSDNREDVSDVSLKIHKAEYGPPAWALRKDEAPIDVAARLRELIKDNSLDIVVNNSTLTPNQNPFRGRKKELGVIYSFDGSEAMIARTVEEKDWLIIGPVGERAENTAQLGVTQAATYVEANKTGLATIGASLSDDDVEFDEAKWQEVKSTATYVGDGKEVSQPIPLPLSGTNDVITVRRLDNPPTTAPALNDYLIRKFHISPQRLRGPMPVELRDFHRNDLAQLFAELGFKRGAEIGVAEGNYSEVLLKANPECELLLVDPWHHYSDNPQGKSKEKHEFAYNETVRKTKGYKNVQIRVGLSMDMVRGVEDGELDFCYVDAHHSYPYVMTDIIEWTKKVRSGGIIAVDDVFKLDEARWGAGPMEAIYDYTRAMRINPWWLIAAHKSVDAFFVKP